MGRVLLLGLGILVAVWAIQAAIVAAAPALAILIVVVVIGLVMYWTDYPSDKKKPPE